MWSESHLLGFLLQKRKDKERVNSNDLGNFIHNCSEQCVDISKLEVIPLFNIYKDNEIKEIYSFYLNNWFSNKGSIFNWSGMKGDTGLNKLEGLLLEKSEIQNFCMLKINKLDNTLEKMKLKKEIRIKHPRAVMMIKYDIKFEDEFQYKLITKEKRIECLLRHIRNSLAHNLTYCFENDNILLEDRNESGTDVTARILIRKDTLINWIKIIKKE